MLTPVLYLERWKSSSFPWFPGKNKGLQLFSDPSLSTSSWAVTVGYYGPKSCKILFVSIPRVVFPRRSIIVQLTTVLVGSRPELDSVISSHKESSISTYHLKPLVALLLKEYETNQMPKFCLILDLLHITTSSLQLQFLHLFKLNFNTFCFYSSLQYPH